MTFLVLLVGIAFVVILIARFKLHPCLSPDSGRHPGWNPVAGSAHIRARDQT